MDGNILQNLACQRSQECQLIDLTLGKLKKMHESEVAILGDLYQENRWRWTPEHGLQVGLPQDLHVRWFSRESVWDLQNRIRPLTLPGGDPDPNADRRLQKQEYVWLLSQMLHYELGFALTPIDAAARIATALRNGNVQQPRKLEHRARKLREKYQAHHNLRNTELQIQATVDEDTSRSDGESEGEHGLERRGTEDRARPAHSVVQSSLNRPRVPKNIEAVIETFALDPVERDDSSNTIENYPQTQAATKSNSSNSSKRPWVSHCETLLRTQDPFLLEQRPIQFSGEIRDKHIRTQALRTLGNDVRASPGSNKGGRLRKMSQKLNIDNLESLSAALSRNPGPSISTSDLLVDDSPQPNRRTTAMPEGNAQSHGNESRAGSIQNDVLKEPHRARAPLFRSGMKYLTRKDKGPWISRSDSFAILQPETPATTAKELKQAKQPREQPPVCILIEDSDSEHHSEHPHKGELPSIRKLKRRKPSVKVTKASDTFYAARSIFSIPPSDISGADHGAQLSSRQRSLSSAPTRISAIFPQMKRVAANARNNTRNKVPAIVRESLQDVSSHSGTRCGMRGPGVCTLKARNSSAPSKRNGSDRVKSSCLQQGTLNIVQTTPVNIHGAQSAKRTRSEKARPSDRAEYPGEPSQVTETRLIFSDDKAQHARIEAGRRNIDSVVEELRHSTQAFAKSFKTSHKNKRSHAAAFNEQGGSRKVGNRKQNRSKLPYGLMKRTGSGTPKSPAPRDHEIPIFPRLEYLLECDENGVPAQRTPFRRPTTLTHTVRDQVGNPLPREKTPLEEVLRYDQERRRRDPRTKASFWSRFPKPSPPRKGCGIWHKHDTSARMPLRRFWPGRPRTG